MEVKPGYKTTELLTLILGAVGTILVALGVITEDITDAVINAVVDAVAAIGAVIAVVKMVIEYIKSRTAVKVAATANGNK